MKISDFLQSIESLDKFTRKDGQTLKQTTLEKTSIWSNEACTGYVLAAMRRAGISEDDAARVIDELKACFDEITVEAAEKFSREKF